VISCIAGYKSEDVTTPGFFCGSSPLSLFGSDMIFVNAKVLLPLLTALAALAAPIDYLNSRASPAADVAVGSDPAVGTDGTPDADFDRLNISAVELLATVTSMTDAQVNALTPYTYYASAEYCNPSVTATWTCGANCNANPGFRPIASGGDGSSIQFCLWHFLFTIPC
jgi:hypothetical protein